jgi:hypothetical protein
MTVNQFIGHFVKVETNVYPSQKKEYFTLPIWADKPSSQHSRSVGPHFLPVQEIL